MYNFVLFMLALVYRGPGSLSLSMAMQVNNKLKRERERFYLKNKNKTKTLSHFIYTGNQIFIGRFIPVLCVFLKCILCLRCVKSYYIQLQ